MDEAARSGGVCCRPCSTKGARGVRPWGFLPSGGFGASAGAQLVLGQKQAGDARGDVRFLFRVGRTGGLITAPAAWSRREVFIKQTAPKGRLFTLGAAERSSANFPHPSRGCCWKVRWKSSSRRRRKHFVAVRVFAIKIGTRLSAYMGTIMTWKKKKPWLTQCSPVLNQNYCSPQTISVVDGREHRNLRLTRPRGAANKDQMFAQLRF